MQSFSSTKENGHDEDVVLERKPIAIKFKCKLICTKRKLTANFTGFTVVLNICSEKYVFNFKCKVGAQLRRSHVLKEVQTVRV